MRELVLVFSLLGGDSFWRIDERRAVGGISWLILIKIVSKEPVIL